VAALSRRSGIHQLLRIGIITLLTDLQTGILAIAIEAKQPIRHSDIQPSVGGYSTSTCIPTKRRMAATGIRRRRKSNMLCAGLAGIYR
jgi:hypothetical protein